MMNDTERRKYNMLARVRDFGANHPAAFPAGTRAGNLLAEITATVDELFVQSATKASGKDTLHAATLSRTMVRDRLRADLDAISRTARSIADEVPEIAGKFKMPRHGSDQSLLDSARAFATDAAAWTPAFAEHELSAAFWQKLQADIAAFERAMTTQRTGAETRMEAGAAIGQMLDAATRAVKKLDSIIRNKFADDPKTLMVWASATHVQRADRKSKPDSEPSAA